MDKAGSSYNRDDLHTFVFRPRGRGGLIERPAATGLAGSGPEQTPSPFLSHLFDCGSAFLSRSFGVLAAGLISFSALMWIPVSDSWFSYETGAKKMFMVTKTESNAH